MLRTFLEGRTSNIGFPTSVTTPNHIILIATSPSTAAFKAKLKMPQNPLLVEHKWPKAITMPAAPAVPLLWPPQAGKEHIPVPKTTQKIFLTKNITEASCDSKTEALNASFKQGHTREVQRTVNQGGGRLFSPSHSPRFVFFFSF